MSESGVSPPTGERQPSPVDLEAGESLTDWHIEGEIRCPDCRRGFFVDCPLENLVKFTALHQCGAGCQGGEETTT